MQTRLLYLALLLAGLSTGAHAGLNKCKGANGHIVVQVAPCPPPPGTATARLPTLAERNALVKQQKQQEKEQKLANGRADANWDPARKPGTPVYRGLPTEESDQNNLIANENARIEAENVKIRERNRIIECENRRRGAGLRGGGDCS